MGPFVTSVIAGWGGGVASVTLRIPSIGGGCLRTGVNPVLMVVALRRERGVVVSPRLLGKLSDVKT